MLRIIHLLIIHLLSLSDLTFHAIELALIKTGLSVGPRAEQNNDSEKDLVNKHESKREWWEINQGLLFPLCEPHTVHRKQQHLFWGDVLQWLTCHCYRNCTLLLNKRHSAIISVLDEHLLQRCWTSLCREYVWFLFAKHRWRSVWPEDNSNQKSLCPLPRNFSPLHTDDIQNNSGNYWLCALFLNILTTFTRMDMGNGEINNYFNFISKNLSDTIINIFFLQLSGQGRIVKYKDEK